SISSTAPCTTWASRRAPPSARTVRACPASPSTPSWTRCSRRSSASAGERNIRLRVEGHPDLPSRLVPLAVDLGRDAERLEREPAILVAESLDLRGDTAAGDADVFEALLVCLPARSLRGYRRALGFERAAPVAKCLELRHERNGGVFIEHGDRTGRLLLL